jgi:hypothetical protein
VDGYGDGARDVGVAEVLVVHALAAAQVGGAAGGLTALRARDLSLGLRLLRAVGALVELLAAVAGGGFDALADSFVGETPHEAFAGFFAGLVDFFKGLECKGQPVVLEENQGEYSRRSWRGCGECCSAILLFRMHWPCRCVA